MKRLKLHLFFALASSVSITHAQYGYGGFGTGGGGGPRPIIAINGGNVAGLKGVTTVNIIYDYSKLGVGAFRNEQDYLKKKEEDYKKDPAKFEKFKNGWFNARKERFEPRFEEMFNKVGSKIGMTGKNYATDGVVTLKIETLFIEPGYNIGISKMPSFIDLECTFLDKNGKEIVRYIVKNATGQQAMGFDYDTGSRLVESYAKACKMLMKDVTKRLKKIK